MYKTKLTYFGVALVWICVLIDVSNGHDGYGDHYHDRDHDPSLRDYHDDFHYDSRRQDQPPERRYPYLDPPRRGERPTPDRRDENPRRRDGDESLSRGK